MAPAKEEQKEDSALPSFCRYTGIMSEPYNAQREREAIADQMGGLLRFSVRHCRRLHRQASAVRIPSPDCRYKASHQGGDFIRRRIQGKVSGVENVDFGFGNVLPIAFGFTEIKRQIVLAPNHQKPRLLL